MQKSYFAVRWVALLLALACAIALPTALYAAAETEPVAESGLVVVALDPGGPAAAAGVKRGDIILAVDGNPVNTIAELMAVLATLPAETTVILQVQHGDEVQDVAVTTAVRAQRAYLGILPYAEPALAVATSAPPLPPVQQPTPLETVPALPAQPEVMAQTVTITPSVVILDVMPGSAAAAAGLQPQDLITAVDGVPVIAPDTLRAHLASLQPGATIILTLTRGDEGPRTVAVKVGKGDAGQSWLGVKLGVSVTTAVTSSGEAQLAMPNPSMAPHIVQKFHRFQEARPSYRWMAPGCMISHDITQGQLAQDFVQVQPDVLMVAPMASGQWAAQPALPVEQNAVVVVQGQLAQEFTQMAEPVQSGMVFVAPAQTVAVPMQSVAPDVQGREIILEDQAAPVQPAAPVAPTVGDYY